MPISLVDLIGGPPDASSMAPRVDTIFWTLVAVSVVVLAGLGLVNFYFLVRYRKSARANRSPIKIKSWKVEATWIAVTTVIFLFFYFWGARIFVVMERVPPGSYQVTVIGRQWMWDIRHPNGRREFNTLHVPIGQNISVLLSSEDVIHSFYVPAFRVKQDVVPGRTVSTWFQATQEGRYPFYCSEFCGTKHSAMIGEIVVQSSEEFGRWLETGTKTDAVEMRGRKLFVQYNCAGCHDQPAPIHAPSLAGLYGSSVPLSNGAFVRADDRYLRDSILQPEKEIVAGFQPIMPTFQGVVNEADLLDLLAYIKSLAPANSDAPFASP